MKRLDERWLLLIGDETLHEPEGLIRKITSTKRWRGRPAHSYLVSVVIPHARLFAGVGVAGELTAGLSLLLGVGTTIGASVAMFLFVHYMLAKARWFWSPDSQDAAVFFEALDILLGSMAPTLPLRRRQRTGHPSVT